MEKPPSNAAAQVVSSDFAEVDNVLQRAIAAGNPLIAADFGNQLTNTMRLKGVAFAKLLFGMRSNWDLFRVAGVSDEFIDFVDAHMRVEGRTAEKYADMYEAVLENKKVPQYIRDELRLKPIQTLLLLTAAVREGDLDADDLETIVLLDHNGVRKVVRERRGDVTNSGRAIYARLITEQGRSYPAGSIVVFGSSQDGRLEVETLGTLNITPHTESGRKYLERIKRKLSLVEMSYDEKDN